MYVVGCDYDFAETNSSDAFVLNGTEKFITVLKIEYVYNMEN